MKIEFQDNSQAKNHNPRAALIRGMAWGSIGGLAGTMVMDVLLMGALSVAGLPAFTCFLLVGDTAASFFSILGIEMAGGVLSGMATHYLIGPLVGALFGAIVSQVYSLRALTPKKGIIFAVLYVEILAQPILASTPILLKMTAAETLLWFGGSFVMHFSVVFTDVEMFTRSRFWLVTLTLTPFGFSATFAWHPGAQLPSVL